MATFARYFKVCKEDDTVTADQLVNNSSTPAEGSSEGSELREVANETEQLQESNEKAAEVVKEVESDIAAQEEIVEKSPEAVTTQDAVTATESFKVKASKLGVDLNDLSLSINKESIVANPLGAMKENIDNMKKFVFVAKESIAAVNRDVKTNYEYMWDMALAYTTHKEYNAVDWPKMFLGSTIVGLWRKFVKGGYTKIANPGILVDIFLGKWTTFGDFFSGQLSGKHLIDAVGLGVSGLNSKTAASLGGLSQTVKDSDNAYYKLVTNQDKSLDVETAKKLVSAFDSVVAELKRRYCKSIPRRELKTGELNDLKLFRPDLIKPELDKAESIAIRNASDSKEKKDWENIYAHLSRSALGVVKYLTENLSGYDYTEGVTVK